MKKFVVSAIAAATMVSFASVAVSAVDYSADPDYGLVEGKPANTVTADTVEAALEADEAVVYIDAAAAVINEEAIAAIAANEDGAVVTFDAGSYKVSIKDIAKATDINVAMDITVAEADDETAPEGAIVIAPAQEGEFGMTLVVTIPAEAVADLNQEKAVLYYVDDEGKVSKDGKLSFDEAGNAIIEITHASQYVITDEEMTVSDTEGDSKGENPGTGVTVAVATAAIAGASAVISVITAKKRK